MDTLQNKMSVSQVITPQQIITFMSISHVATIKVTSYKNRGEMFLASVFVMGQTINYVSIKK